MGAVLGLVGGFGGEGDLLGGEINDFSSGGGFLGCRGGRCCSPGTVKGVSTWLVSVGENPERGKWLKSGNEKVLKIVKF